MNPGYPDNDLLSITTYPWIPDQGDGTFRNPILFADYSDPDVIRHGDDLYMVASSFNCTPGLPILHSRDLVNWTVVNHALKNLPDPRYQDVQPGCGVWAPAIRFHAGKFWIFFPTPDEGIYMVNADDPTGEWSAPHLVQAGRGLIDPCPLWDEDGQAYLVFAYAGSRAGIKDRLCVAPMAPDGARLLGEGQIVFHDPLRHPTMEGLKFLKKDGWYYILAPAGGVPLGWQVALRSRNIYGPYEDRIVLAQGSTRVNGPHQGALVDLPGGDWWFVHFQELLPYGRIVHLQPARWEDGWPLIGVNQNSRGIGEPVLAFQKPAVRLQNAVAFPQTSDEFDDPALSHQWQWYANHDPSWFSLDARKGCLRLQSIPSTPGDLATPSFLGQKFPASAFTAETVLEFFPERDGEIAGLAVVGTAQAAIAIKRAGHANQAVFIQDGVEKFLQTIPGRVIHLKLVVQQRGRCTFSYSLPGGEWLFAGEKFQAIEGRWIGAKAGIFSITPHTDHAAGHSDFDYFRFSPAPHQPQQE